MMNGYEKFLSIFHGNHQKINDLHRLKFLEEEIALAEKKMEYNSAMNPIIIYMRKRLATVKEQLESSND